MKKNIFLSLAFLGFSFFHQAYAEQFTCPQIKDFKCFPSFVVEYPLSKDPSTQEFNSWLVAQLNFRKLPQHILDSLFISPVHPNAEESPSDAASKILPDFVADSPEPFIDDFNPETQMFVCTYTNPHDGSIANFIRLVSKKDKALSAMHAMQAFAKLHQH
ncbi:MAG TPA: hypothetical protein DCZ80_06070 [Legionellales bacterium]|nr:hypothetical protein [Legionellales bacterium]